MAIVTTRISIPSENRSFDIQADFSEAQIRAAYAAQLPSIGNMTCTETIQAGVAGDTRVLTFSPRTGNKG